MKYTNSGIVFNNVKKPATLNGGYVGNNYNVTKANSMNPEHVLTDDEKGESIINAIDIDWNDAYVFEESISTTGQLLENLNYIYENTKNSYSFSGLGLDLNVDEDRNLTHSNAKITPVTTDGLYKISFDANGHILSYASVAKNDITALGIPSENTVYTLPKATTGVLGGILSSNTLSTAVSLTSTNGTTSNRYYGVQTDKDGKAFVNVPWTDTNTKVTTVGNHYVPSGGTELSASLGTAGTYAKNTEYTVLTGVSLTKDTAGHVTGLSATTQKIKDTDTNYVAGGGLSLTTIDGNQTFAVQEATTAVLGGIKIGYSTSGKNYAVQLSSGKAYVNVPWTEYTKATDSTLGLIKTGYVQTGSNYPIKLDSNGNAYVSVVAPAGGSSSSSNTIPIVVKTTTTESISPNTVNRWSSAVTSLTLSLNPITDGTGAVYTLRFKTGTSFSGVTLKIMQSNNTTIDTSAKLYSQYDLTWNVNTEYEVSILYDGNAYTLKQVPLNQLTSSSGVFTL